MTVPKSGSSGFRVLFDKRWFLSSFPSSRLGTQVYAQAPAWATPLKPSDTSTSNTPDSPFLRHSQAVRAACLSPSLRDLKPINIGKQELSTQVRSQAGAWERERGMPSRNQVRFSRMNRKYDNLWHQSFCQSAALDPSTFPSYTVFGFRLSVFG